MTLDLIDAALRGMALALTLLLAVQLARLPRPRPPVATAALLLCLGLAVQVPGSAPGVEHLPVCGLHAPLVAVAVGNGVLFVLFTAALFDDGFRFRPWHAAAWAVAALVGSVQCHALVGWGPGPETAVLRAALRAVTLACVIAAAWIAVRHWRDDLVEVRRRLRVWLVGAGVVYTAVQLAGRLGSPGGLLTPGLALVDVALLLAVVGGWALAVLRLPVAELLAPARPVPVDDGAGPSASPAAASPPPPSAGDAAEPPDAAGIALAEALERAMREERAYRDEALTIAALAARLAVPEYRLRRHINQRLGFRNFSAFVNAWRLADARRWLADPAHRDAPIVTLALDAGFGSIGPFNRAFKAETGLTPTEFRARALAGGAAPD